MLRGSKSSAPASYVGKRMNQLVIYSSIVATQEGPSQTLWIPKPCTLENIQLTNSNPHTPRRKTGKHN